MSLLISFALATSVAQAGPSVVEVAEYHRLRQEMYSLAERQAWTGVERAYQGCLHTGKDLTFRDHLTGAWAASELGDVSKARERLWSAHQLNESRDVIEWMWAIDTEYGEVELAVDPGKEPLVVDDPPFHPTARRAIDLAQVELDGDGTYTGLLPAGDYQLGEAGFQIAGRGRPVSVDITSEPKRPWWALRR